MAEARFILNAKDEDCYTYYTGNQRLIYVSGELWFSLWTKTFDGLSYFGLYNFTLLMRTDTLLTALTFEPSTEVVSDRMDTKGGSLHYKPIAAEVLGLKKESVQVGKRTLGGGVVPQLQVWKRLLFFSSRSGQTYTSAFHSD